MPDIPSVGWYVEVDASSGHTHRPRVVGEPRKNPVVKGLPTLEIPVAKDEKWVDLQGQPLKVWEDGVRQPVDTLETIQESQDVTTLVGRGGTDLDTRVEKEYDSETADTVADEVIQAASAYTRNVDSYTASTTTNEVVQTADTNTEFTENLLASIASTDPLKVRNGSLEALQTAWVQEGEIGTQSSGTLFGEVGDWSDGYAYGVNASGESASWTFTTEHKIPADNFALYARHISAEPPQDCDLYVDLSNGTTVQIDNIDPNNTVGLSLSWTDHSNDPLGGTNNYGWGTDDVPAGTHTIRLEAASADGNRFAFDVLAPLDDRYSYTIDNQNDGASGYLDGPELYPDAVQQEFADAETVQSVSGARVESSWNDTSGSQQLAVSNDGGSSWKTSANSSTYETDFASLGATVRWRATLSRYGSRTTATPKQGFNGQTLDSYTLKADLDDTPLIVQERYDGSAVDILNRVAERANAVWEYRRDNGGASVEWTWPGQRTAGESPSVARYDSQTTVAEKYEKAVVKGSAQRVRKETFTANHGTAVDLNEGNLQHGREVVYDTATDDQFVATSDYRIDAKDGKITTLSGGDMTNGDTYAIDYMFQPENSHTKSGASSPRTIVRTIPALSTTRGCGQAALRLVDALDESLEEATVTVPADEADWSVVDELTLDVLPFDSGVQIREVESIPGRTVLRLGSRESVAEVVDDIRNRVEAINTRI